MIRDGVCHGVCAYACAYGCSVCAGRVEDRAASFCLLVLETRVQELKWR